VRVVASSYRAIDRSVTRWIVVTMVEWSSEVRWELVPKTGCRVHKHGNIGQTNNDLCYFGKLVSDVKYRLFRSYCSSMYGSALWYIGDKCVNKLCTEWRKGLRRIWNLPYDAHCDTVTAVSGSMSILGELCMRSVSFVAKGLNHSSALIRFIILLHIMVYFLLLKCR